MQRTPEAGGRAGLLLVAAALLAGLSGVGCRSVAGDAAAEPAAALDSEETLVKVYDVADLTNGEPTVPREGCCVLFLPADPALSATFPTLRSFGGRGRRSAVLQEPAEVLLRDLRGRTGILEDDRRGWTLELHGGGNVLAVCPASVHSRIEGTLTDLRRTSEPR
jgi:hypothetical protein